LQGEAHMSLALVRVTKFVYVAFFGAATKLNGAQFLRKVVEAFLYAIRTVLTNNGAAFAEQPRYHGGMSDSRGGGHIFERVCRQHDIDHRLTKPYHPWTDGQAERMNRTVKEATIKAFHYPDLEDLKAHALAFVTAYHFAKHLKALRWRKPFQAVCDAWGEEPSRLNLDPQHLAPGPNTQPKT
jgi:transposase InsO family protein